jgi:hypothetical protein
VLRAGIHHPVRRPDRAAQRQLLLYVADLRIRTGGVRGFTLNPALRSYLLERAHATEPGKLPPPPQSTSTPLPQRHRLRDRLSEQDLSTLVENFRSGTSAHVLAKRYSVGETALKALLRQRGVRRRPQKPNRDEDQTG